MITSIELENVRIFEDGDWKFPLRPLTVFCGTNSSGKSTILKTLLLLRQTQGIDEPYSMIPGKLRFSGTQVDLGNYCSFVSHNECQREVGLAITIKDVMPSGLVELIRAANKGEGFSDSGSIQKDKTADAHLPYSLRAFFKFKSLSNTASNLLSLAQELDELSTSHSQSLLTYAHFQMVLEQEKPTLKQEKLLSWEVVRAEGDASQRGSYQILIPQKHFEAFRGFKSDAIKLDLSQMVEIENEKFIKFEAALRGLLPISLIAQLQVSDNKHSDHKHFIPINLPIAIAEAYGDLQKALKQVEYLAPLRTPAERYYIAPYDNNPAMDPAGKFLPYILRDRGKKKVKTLLPGQLGEAKGTALSVALNSWLHYLRTGQKPELNNFYSDEIKAAITGDVLVELKIKTVDGDESHALADSGFGYPQVLPILVRGLLAEKGSVLVIEQPELHLNPALQVRLAEFFVAMMRSGKQVLIETHSEHIVDAIRVFAAEDESGEIARNSGIFYIDAESERPHVYPMDIEPDGTMNDWPPHFFGEALSLSGRLLRAQRRFLQKSARTK